MNSVQRFEVGDRVKHINPQVKWIGTVIATPESDPWRCIVGMVLVRREGKDIDTDGVTIPASLLEFAEEF
ncbi:MAG: hypothetical protein Kow00121_34430 [Elainellaceae cyanobacterium]